MSFELKESEFYDSVYVKKDYQEEAAQILRWLPEHTKILDVGCGTGKHALAWEKMGHEVVGIEPSHDMAIKASENGFKKIQLTEIENMNTEFFGEYFDAVVAMFDVMDYLIDFPVYTKAIQKISSVLKPGGLLFLEGWNKETMPARFEHIREIYFFQKGVRYARVGETLYDDKTGVFHVHYGFYRNLGFKERELICESDHFLKPRLGGKQTNKFLESFGYEIRDQWEDDYSVRLILKKK